MKIYVVQKGDTLSLIAKKHGIVLSDLLKMNPQLTNPDNIMPGMKIKVPTGSKPVKKKEMPKEAPINVKKELPKEAPINVKKEMPKEAPMNVKKEIPKEAPVKAKKEAPIAAKKEAPIHVKKVAVKETAPVAPKSVKEKAEPKKEGPAIGKMLPDEVKYKPTEILAPSIPLMDGEWNAPGPEINPGQYQNIPMMEEPFPNMIAPKKDVQEPMGKEDEKPWDLPYGSPSAPVSPSAYYPEPAYSPSSDYGPQPYPAPYPSGYAPVASPYAPSYGYQGYPCGCHAGYDYSGGYYPTPYGQPVYGYYYPQYYGAFPMPSGYPAASNLYRYTDYSDNGEFGWYGYGVAGPYDQPPKNPDDNDHS